MCTLLFPVHTRAPPLQFPLSSPCLAEVKEPPPSPSLGLLNHSITGVGDPQDHPLAVPHPEQSLECHGQGG